MIIGLIRKFNILMSNNKTIILVLIVSFTANCSFSQVVYFDTVYHFTPWNYWDFARNVIEVDDGYILQGQTSEQNNIDWYRIGFSKIDTVGNQVWMKSYGDTISEWIIGRSGSLIKSSSGGFYSVGTKRTPTDDWVFDQGLIMRYDDNLDTLWTKLHCEKTEPVDTAYMLQQVKQLDNKDLVIVGLAYPYGKTSRIYLIKTDSLGNKIWDKWLGFGSTNYFYSYSVIQTSDHGYAIGGVVHYWPDNQEIDPIVIKTDSLGNQEWIKYLGGPYKDHQAFVANSNNNTIIVGMNIADEPVGTTEYNGRITLAELDIEGNIIWEKKYGSKHYLSRLYCVITLENNSIIATGYHYTDFPHTEGWILKTSSEGDSIWMRNYDYADLSIYSDNWLFDIKATFDGGLIACGDVKPHDPDPGNQDAWVLKLDSNGCDTPNCDPTVIMPIQIANRGSIEVFPNPADKQFVVRCSPDNYREFVERNCVIQVFDLFGRKVKEIKVPKGKEQIIVNVENWKRGLYLLRVSSGDGYAESVKVVIE
ncbi:MAG: T9SS type A sorting domain-containing protein [Bacteroidales bacterium]|nr:T9SS type A sorting domain-containing protein [Bacteroidales bacterium]MCF8376754.1 T9SS type A sorting domain-containing protein [Bacteroidales bacterium]